MLIGPNTFKELSPLQKNVVVACTYCEHERRPRIWLCDIHAGMVMYEYDVERVTMDSFVSKFLDGYNNKHLVQRIEREIAEAMEPGSFERFAKTQTLQVECVVEGMRRAGFDVTADGELVVGLDRDGGFIVTKEKPE